MNIGTRVASVLSIALLCVLAVGCDGARDARPAVTTDADAEKSFIGRQAAKAIAEASRKLETENISIGDSHITVNGSQYFSRDPSTGNLPKAEITPRGELLIEGEPVSTTAGQRELLLAHRRHLLDLAQAGMAMGAQGADIAGSALTGIGSVLFGGDEGRRAYEQRIEVEAEKLKREATRLCTLLPPLYDSQQALAASLPAFAPYATMSRDEVEECGKDLDTDPDADAASGSRT